MTSRRSFLKSAGLGLGWMAALDLLQAERANPLAPRASHYPAQAKAVIHLFMQGGPSHMDTFDPKPLLNELHGQHPPESFGNEDFQNGQFRDSIILGSKRMFARHGESGSRSRICSRTWRRWPTSWP